MLDRPYGSNKLALTDLETVQEVAMRRLLLIAAMTIATASAALLFASRGQAADLNANTRHFSRSDCGPYGCQWQRKLSRCPDRLSCYPLYGAYGPYGGAAYWGAYSYDYAGYRYDYVGYR
jgi:hypothetical protein